MKSRDDFVRHHDASWNELDLLLARGRLGPSELSRLSALYRSVCRDVMTARAAALGTDL